MRDRSGMGTPQQLAGHARQLQVDCRSNSVIIERAHSTTSSRLHDSSGVSCRSAPAPPSACINSPSARDNSSVGCRRNFITERAHSSAQAFGAQKTYLQWAISREPQPHSGSSRSSPGSLDGGSLRASFFSEPFRLLLYAAVTFLLSFSCAVKAS